MIELDQELPKPLRVFFSEIVLRWIHLYRLGQGESDALRHVALLEEVDNLFPRSLVESMPPTAWRISSAKSAVLVKGSLIAPYTQRTSLPGSQR